MKKSNIRVFGEASIAHVEKRGLFSYVVVRDCDKKVIAKSFSFRKYMNDIIRTMYTGEYYYYHIFRFLYPHRQRNIIHTNVYFYPFYFPPIPTLKFPFHFNKNIRHHHISPV
jgi:hypothetical protein